MKDTYEKSKLCVCLFFFESIARVLLQSGIFFLKIGSAFLFRSTGKSSEVHRTAPSNPLLNSPSIFPPFTSKCNCSKDFVTWTEMLQNGERRTHTSCTPGSCSQLLKRMANAPIPLSQTGSELKCPRYWRPEFTSDFNVAMVRPPPSGV